MLICTLDELESDYRDILSLLLQIGKIHKFDLFQGEWLANLNIYYEDWKMYYSGLKNVRSDMASFPVPEQFVVFFLVSRQPPLLEVLVLALSLWRNSVRFCLYSKSTQR